MLVDIEVGNELSGGLRVGVKQRRGAKREWSLSSQRVGGVP